MRSRILTLWSWLLNCCIYPRVMPRHVAMADGQIGETNLLDMTRFQNDSLDPLIEGASGAYCVFSFPLSVTGDGPYRKAVSTTDRNKKKLQREQAESDKPRRGGLAL